MWHADMLVLRQSIQTCHHGAACPSVCHPVWQAAGRVRSRFCRRCRGQRTTLMGDTLPRSAAQLWHCPHPARALPLPSRLPAAAPPAEPRRIKIPVVIMQPDTRVDVGYILRAQQAQQAEGSAPHGCHDLDGGDQRFRWGSFLKFCGLVCSVWSGGSGAQHP